MPGRAAHMFDPIEPGGEEREMEFAEFLQRVGADRERCEAKVCSYFVAS